MLPKRSGAAEVPSRDTFGAQTPLVATNLTVEGQVTLRCNAGAAPVLAVNDGANFSGTRRMSDGGGTPKYVAYAVKQPTISGTDFTTCPAFGAGTAWTSAHTPLETGLPDSAAQVGAPTNSSADAVGTTWRSR